MLQKIALLLGCVLMLSSCALSLEATELLAPPRLTSQQTEIYDALESALGTPNFKLKYPRRGQYLSACILRDINRDGKEEAIAFYELTVAGITSTWMSLLEQQADGWRSVKEIPGNGSDIDLVQFAPVTSAEYDNIIVGWSVAGRDESNCTVYTFDDRQLRQAHDTDFFYNEMLVTSVDDNDLNEIILCTKGGARTPVMRLLKYRSGKIVTTSQIEMPGATVGYQQLLFGPLTENLSAIFADIILPGNTMTSKIAVVDRSIITEITEEDLGIYESFDRDVSQILCTDANGDGYIDIPVSIPLPGYASGVEGGEMLMRTEYKSLQSGSLVTVSNAIFNRRGGYRLTIPESWVSRVTVKVSPDANEWSFCLFTGDLATSTEEILRIRVLSSGDYEDKLETESYRTIATKGGNQYKAYIPPTVLAGISITYDELSRMFHPV